VHILNDIKKLLTRAIKLPIVITGNKGEIKPFGYAIRRFILVRILKMGEQKRVRGKEPYEYSEGDSSKISPEIERVALTAYLTVEMADDERLILIESYCKNCKSKTTKIVSNKTRRIICTGCGRELAKL
jgi:hypothetical protein